MVRIEMKYSVSGPCCVSYVDAGDPAGYEYSFDLSPGLVEIFVHGLVAGCRDLSEEIVPDRHHRIRGRCHNKMDGFVIDLSHLTAVPDDHSMIRTRHVRSVFLSFPSDGAVELPHEFLGSKYSYEISRLLERVVIRS